MFGIYKIENKSPNNQSSRAKQKYISDNSRPAVEKFVKLKNLLNDSSYVDRLHLNTCNTAIACNAERCMGSLFQPTKKVDVTQSKEDVIKAAVDLINQLFAFAKG